MNEIVQTPTPAQRVALEEIRVGRIERFYPQRLGYRKSADPRWVAANHGRLLSRQDTLDRVVRAGWARVLPGSPARSHAGVELTDAGREALACHS